MAKKKLTKHEEMMLSAMKHTRDRSPMPRPCRFKDKTKYDRNRAKAQLARDNARTVKSMYIK